MASPNQKIGSTAEEKASLFLQNQGLKPLARNWRNRYGEIDLIMLDNDDVVLVEVRSRRSTGYGDAIESVTHKKRAILLRTAEAWLCRYRKGPQPNVRYDVVGISGDKLEWVKNAFDADNR